MSSKGEQPMQTSDETLNQQKVIALILCLFLLFMYKESVWDPYFNPDRAPRPAVPAAAEETKERESETPTETLAEGAETR